MSAMVPPTTDEREHLMAYLAQQRYLVTVQAHGLSDEQARLRPTAGTLSIGGLLKHLARVERAWIGDVLGRPHQSLDKLIAEHLDAFTLREDETLEDALRDYRDAARETDQVLRSLPLDHAVPVPKEMPWMPRDVDSWQLRWVILHLIEETARHLGHADIIRESVDGAQAVPLIAAVEGWPESQWIKPWRPAAEAAEVAAASA